jgi:hypothetical protein
MVVPMFERIAGKADLTHSAAYALLESQEPLPPYELDPAFDSPAVRKRIGEVIAKAIGKRIPKRRNRVGSQ